MSRKPIVREVDKNVGDMLFRMAGDAMKKQIKGLEQDGDAINTLIEGKCSYLILLGLSKLTEDDLLGMDPKERADFIKRIAEIKRSVSKKVDTALQVNINQLTAEEAKRFDIEI